MDRSSYDEKKGVLVASKVRFQYGTTVSSGFKWIAVASILIILIGSIYTNIAVYVYNWFDWFGPGQSQHTYLSFILVTLFFDLILLLVPILFLLRIRIGALGTVIGALSFILAFISLDAWNTVPQLLSLMPNLVLGIKFADIP